MKRIAIFAYHHSESTLPLAKHLAARGCEVDYYFVTSSRQSSAPALDFGRTVYVPGLRWRNARPMREVYRYFGNDRVKVILAVVPPYARRIFGPFSRAFFFVLGRALRRRRYDLVVVVGQDAFLLDLHRGLGRAPNVYHALHEVTPHYAGQRVSYPLIDSLMERGAKVIVHSKAAQRMLASRYGADIPNVSVIPFGVFETYTTFGGPAEKPLVGGQYFLFLGTILPYKGLDVLLAAVEGLGETLRDWRVVVAGAGTDQALEAMKTDGRYVVLHRYLSNHEVANLTRNAACVVCPYKSASQSGIVSMAFMFGRPVIASDVGGFSEFIVSGRNGVLTPPGDAVALADAMKAVAENESLRKALEVGAGQFASDERYSWESLAGRYAELAEQESAFRVEGAGETPRTGFGK